MSGRRRLIVAVGLTGGIGAGKSTALRLFGDLGAITLSADQVVHDLYREPRVARQVAAHFGPQVLDPEGAVDRRRLGGLVHGRRDELRWLEQLIHPQVSSAIKKQIDAAPEGSVVVVEVPLLVESGLRPLFDLVVTVEAAAENRRHRSVHGFGPEQFAELESLQAATDQRVAGSDFSFFNDAGISDLATFVRDVFGRARDMLGEGC